MAQATIATTVTGLQGHPVSNSVPATGQALVFNGTQWQPDNTTFLQTAGGTMTGNLTLTGAGVTLTAPAANITGALSVGGAVTLDGNTTSTGNITTSGNISTTGSGTIGTPTNAGQFVNGAGVNIISGRANGVATTGAAYTTSSTTLVASGNYTNFIPRLTGRCMIWSIGLVANNSSSGIPFANLIINYGTGTAPAQGAANTGTAATVQIYPSMFTGGTTMGYSTIGYITGLTIGTTYWFANFFCSGASGFSTTISQQSINVLEV